MGPNFYPPTPPVSKKYTALPQPHKTLPVSNAGMAGRSQWIIEGRDIPGEWWRLFHSIKLNRLIEQGIRHNPTLAAAKAALKESHELLRAQIGNAYFPKVNLNFEAKENKFSVLTIGIPTSNTFTLYTGGFQATYLLDFFGEQRRLVESDRAQVNYNRYEMLAAYLSLTSNIVSNYINITSLQAQIKTTQQLIRDQTETFKLVQQQYRVGGASEADVISQKTLLAQTKATLPPLRKSLADTQHALAILVGKYPGDFKPKYDSLKNLTLPTNLPLSIPSKLIRQRPDIQASQALLHVACAKIGVATANLYPQITLSGNYGWIAQRLTNFFRPQNEVWEYVGNLLQPLFEGGALHAKKRATVAAFQQSFAEYHETVLEAFKEVADALRAIELDAKEFFDQYQAEWTAKQNLDIAKKQFKVGSDDYLNVLSAEQTYLEAKLNRIKAQAAKYTDTVLLFQAMGGGWWMVDGGIMRLTQNHYKQQVTTK